MRVTAREYQHQNQRYKRINTAVITFFTLVSLELIMILARRFVLLCTCMALLMGVFPSTVEAGCSPDCNFSGFTVSNESDTEIRIRIASCNGHAFLVILAPGESASLDWPLRSCVRFAQLLEPFRSSRCYCGNTCPLASPFNEITVGVNSVVVR